MSDIRFPDLGSGEDTTQESEKARKLKGQIKLSKLEQSQFVERAIKRCKTNHILSSSIPQFLCDFMTEYFEDCKPTAGTIKLKMKELKVSGGLYRPYVVPLRYHFNQDPALEFKRIFNALGYEGRFNSFKDKREFRGIGEKEWHEWDSSQENIFLSKVSAQTSAFTLNGNRQKPNLYFVARFYPKQTKEGLSPSLFKSYGSAEIFENNKVDPFKEWLKAIP